MAGSQIPANQQQIIVTKLGTNFRDVTELRTGPVPSPGDQQILVKNKFLGINATDVNYTAGREANVQPPFLAGMEGLGEVVALGKNSKFQTGQFVAYLHLGAFAEYVVVDDAGAVLVPSPDPAYMCIALSGLTASLALEKEGDLKPGKTVLVTAAAGGTGQFAVQLAKLAGCHVVGTCSSPQKAEFLENLGCDRPVNYREEKLDEVLKKEYPKGIDVTYEGVGKDMFDAALKNLAEFGRIIILGQISAYGDNDSKTNFTELVTASEVSITMSLLVKSASLRGFWLTSYIEDFPCHMQKLSELYDKGTIQVHTDKGEKFAKGPFVGLEKVVDAMEYMYERKNLGKVVIEIK